MDERPLCVGREQLFDSTEPADHEQAKALCLMCPVLDWCRNEYERARRLQTLASDGPQGTWAGMYLGQQGKPTKPRVRRAVCGTPSGYKRHYRLGEEYCAKCRAARAREVRERKDRRQAS